MKLSSGNMEIYATGSLVPAGKRPIEIIFDEAAPPLRFKFDFDNDASPEMERAQLQKSEDGGLKITFFNFTRGVDNANPYPLMLGKLHGKNLYFSYRINAIPGDLKILNYTWYLGDPQNEN
jgi:hypothetical protein